MQFVKLNLSQVGAAVVSRAVRPDWDADDFHGRGPNLSRQWVRGRLVSET